jgi:hypothetical protein
METKPKKGDEAQTITNESMETQVYRSCWHISSQEQKTKPINSEPKEKITGDKFLTPQNWDKLPRPN